MENRDYDSDNGSSANSEVDALEEARYDADVRLNAHDIAKIVSTCAKPHVGHLQGD